MNFLRKAKACFQLTPDTDTKTCDNNHEQLEPTSLWLPPIDKDEGIVQRLYLPKSSSAPCSLDEHLSKISTVRSRAKSLLSLCEPKKRNKRRLRQRCSSSSSCILEKKVDESQSCLNVLQGEVAHASSLQTDIIVSADATTCHVVALWSNISTSIPLASVAHIDDVAGMYKSCLESMILEHIFHHDAEKNGSGSTSAAITNEDSSNDFGFFCDSDEELTPESSTSSRSTLIEIELHIVGGYLDKDGTSQEISTSLIQTFSELATKYQNQVRILLSTAAISCMNTKYDDKKSNVYNGPKSRGLGIETMTGKVFPISNNIPTQWEGPAIDIRSARSFVSISSDEASSSIVSSERSNKKTLAVIHDSLSGGKIRIQPFEYQPIHQLNALLQAPDNILLQVASSSPECELESFCTKFRKTVSFVNTVPIENVFGDVVKDPKPLIFSRSANNLHQWEQICQSSE